MANMPLMARRKTTFLLRHILRFHQLFLSRVGHDSKEVLRCVAWQLEEYLEENGKYKDTEYLRTIQAIIEFYVQKKGGTDWSIAKAKRDMRGRGFNINQYAKPNAPRKRPHVPVDLSQSIDQRLRGGK